MCCDSWGRKEPDMTENLNCTELMSSLEKCLFSSLAHFLIGLFIFLALNYMSFLYILESNSLSVVSFAPILRVVFSPCLEFPLLCKSF